MQNLCARPVHLTARHSPAPTSSSCALRKLPAPRSFRPPNRTRRQALRVSAAGDDDGVKALAPLALTSSTGQFLNYILASEPQLFEDAVKEQLSRMAQEIPEAPKGGSELVLFERIRSVKLQQQQRSVEDLMYASILHQFVSGLGVDLLPPLQNVVELGGSNYKALTEGVHSVEAIALVKEHLSNLLGGGQPQYSYAKMKISKLQAAQVYAASVMFGYFLRRADRRFQLDRALGTLPKSPEDTLSTLESMFNSADLEGDAFVNPDFPEIGAEGSSKMSLKQYVEQFDAETLSKIARIVSVEGVTLVERHTGALFGSIEELNREFQSAMGDEPIETPQQLSDRIQDAVARDKVKTLVLSYGAQQHVILEAVAFGSFLRDAESLVAGQEPRLLTPAPEQPQQPPPRYLRG